MEVFTIVCFALGFMMLGLSGFMFYLSKKPKETKFENFVGNLQGLADALKANVGPTMMDEGVLYLRDKDGNPFEVVIRVGDDPTDTEEYKHVATLGNSVRLPEGSMDKAKTFTFSPQAAYALRMNGRGLDEVVIEMLRASGRI